MRSARSQLPRLAIAASCGALLLGAASGCTSTQEKAAKHQAEAKRILDAREKRQQNKKQGKNKKNDGKEGGSK